MIVTAALQQYADRGVFRGFSVARRPGGRYTYTFTWLMQRPFSLRYDPARRVLSFESLFPHVAARSSMAGVLRDLVAERTTRRVPAHKRLDGRLVLAACGVERRRFTLTMRVRGAPGRNEAYAVRHLLNLVNELVLVLHEAYPDYLIAHFGLSSE